VWVVVFGGGITVIHGWCDCWERLCCGVGTVASAFGSVGDVFSFFFFFIFFFFFFFFFLLLVFVGVRVRFRALSRSKGLGSCFCTR